jgi:phosphatidylinositol alpha 1,6-mannosyltransferase
VKPARASSLPTPDLLAALLAIEGQALAGHSGQRHHAAQAVQRVAIFTEAFLPKIDGVSRTALITIRHLQHTQRDVLVFAPRPALAYVGQTPVQAVPSLYLPEYPETRVTLPLPSILRQVAAFKPDLIHLFSPFSLGAVGMVAGARLGVPVVANYQTDLPAYSQSHGVGGLHGTFVSALRFIHNGCTLTLAPSLATQQELRRWRFRRLRLWGRGVDSARFRPSRRSEAWRARLLAGRDPNCCLALYVGRMAKEKHLEMLVPLAQNRQIALALVGGGEHRAEVERLLLANGGQAHFFGHLLGDDLADAYAAADLFVFPGWEEAIASGLPVVVSNRGGPSSFVRDGHTGFTCPPGDADFFAVRAAQLATDFALRQAMGKAAQAEAAQHTWPGVMAQLEQYYGEAAQLYDRHLAWQN